MQIGTEQFRGRATPQSDIFALGASLFFMLTGEEPEPITQSHPGSIRADLCADIDRIVSKATALNLADRYKDVDELLADLLLLQSQ